MFRQLDGILKEERSHGECAAWQGAGSSGEKGRDPVAGRSGIQWREGAGSSATRLGYAPPPYAGATCSRAWDVHFSGASEVAAEEGDVNSGTHQDHSQLRPLREGAPKHHQKEVAVGGALVGFVNNHVGHGRQPRLLL